MKTIPKRNRAAAVLVMSVVAIAFVGSKHLIWRRLEYYDLGRDDGAELMTMSDEAFEPVYESCPRPYVYELSEQSGGAVLMYGSEHTKDPHDPMIADIERRWDEFRPTVALLESRLGTFFVGLMDPVKTFSEPGAVYALARASGVRTYTWEPRREDVIGMLLRTFTPDQVALSLILGPYFSNLRHGRPLDPEVFVSDFLDRGRLPGLGGTLTTIKRVDTIWKRDFAGHPDWRDTSDEYGLPGYLAAIAADSNVARNRHLTRLVIHMVEQGERVFVIAGSSHAVRLEPALRNAWVGPSDAPRGKQTGSKNAAR